MREFPRESCGLIVDDAYVPMPNRASNPEQDFRIAGADTIAYRGRIQAIVHSHPNGPDFPSMNDMKGQIATALPWIIVPCCEERTRALVVWSDNASPSPLLGRNFVHGVSDCYTLIKDAFRLGKNALADQGVTDAWPFDPIALAEFPREDDWWTPEGEGDGADLYAKGFASQGFRPIAREEARPGDVFLMKIRSKQLNHGGLLIANDLILHHLPGRLSLRAPAGIWARAADMWIRHDAA